MAKIPPWELQARAFVVKEADEKEKSGARVGGRGKTGPKSNAQSPKSSRRGEAESVI